MKRVAIINGVAVYSDKQVTDICNSHITFADGSTCDASTRTVDNRGPGGIQIGEGGGDCATQEKVTKGPMRFSTTDLRVSSLVANVVVEAWDQPGMEVTVSGMKNAVDRITAKPEGSTLSIGCDDAQDEFGDADISGVSIRSGRGGSAVCVSGSIRGSVIITGGNAGVPNADITAVTVKMPRGANLTLDGLNGNAQIGHVDGVLNVCAKGNGEICCGRMRAATIAILGGVDVHISEVNGPLSAQIMGSGDVRVMSGAVTALNVQIMGSGDFHFGGAADTATLCVMGSGDIDVAKVKAKPVKSRLGSGDINVG